MSQTQSKLGKNFPDLQTEINFDIQHLILNSNDYNKEKFQLI